MKKKGFYLAIALFLPVFIFMFLRFFGKNQFDIPVYFQNGVADIAKECGGDYTKPYHVPDSVMGLARQEESTRATLIVLDSSSQLTTNLKRLWNDFEKDEVAILNLENYSSHRLAKWKQCVLMAEESWTVVLVDDDKRIRGYYNPVSLEETDRMLVELKILLKKY